MKLLIFIILPLLFGLITGCISVFQPGLYENCEHSHCQQIYFESDSTFKSVTSYHIGGCCSINEGYYRVNSDTIILNSHVQPRKPIVEYESKLPDSSAGFIQITVADFDGHLLDGVMIRIDNDDSVKIANELGKVRTYQESIDSLLILAIGLEEKIKIEQPFARKIDITVDVFFEEFYKNKMLLYRKNRLYGNYDEGNGKFQLKKTTLANKKFLDVW